MASEAGLRRPGRRLVVVALLVVAVSLSLLDLFVLPISHAVSYTVWLGQHTPDEASHSLCPSGATAYVTFEPYEGSPPANFTIFDPSGGTVWSGQGANGSTTFTVQTCGAYEFEVSPSEQLDVTIMLSWTSHLL